MEQHSEESNREENIKTENEFLKMKLMLQQGAKFETRHAQNDFPDEVENEFLNYITAYEKQAAERKTIKVFDRIEQPDHFKPVNEIPDDEINASWEQLVGYLNEYNIDLAVCSPNVNVRELYRFATEELFEYEMNDIFIPGGMTCFTYDEFYPDPIYENTNIALDDCIKCILEKQFFSWMPMLKKENLRINDRYPLSEKEYLTVINCFKDAYEDIKLNEVTNTDYVIEDNNCRVNGKHDIILVSVLEEINLKGKWFVEFEFDDFGFWEINPVQVEGINF
ncbi:MAG: hypothetical protein ABI237_12150 [Ginsengibacter sp.]